MSSHAYAGAALSFAGCVYALMSLPDIQVWLQEFAWTEADEAVKLAARNMTLPEQDKQQPLFCFETMMHMLYWSCLVYDYKRVSYLFFGWSSMQVEAQ